VAEFFVRRPIVAMVIAIITVIVGTVALQTLPIAEYPAITPPMVEVSGTYTGASAVNVGGQRRAVRRHPDRAEDQRGRGHDLHELD